MEQIASSKRFLNFFQKIKKPLFLAKTDFGFAKIRQRKTECSVFARSGTQRSDEAIQIFCLRELAETGKLDRVVASSSRRRNDWRSQLSSRGAGPASPTGADDWQSQFHPTSNIQLPTSKFGATKRSSPLLFSTATLQA